MQRLDTSTRLTLISLYTVCRHRSQFAASAVWPVLIWWVVLVEVTCGSRLALADHQADTPMDVADGEAYARDQKAPHGNAEIGGVPALFRTPETGLGGGAVLIYIPPDEGGRVSSALGGILYTEKRQFLTGLYLEKYFDRDHWAAEFYVSLQNYPDLFFGIGHNTQEADAEPFTWRQRKVAASLRYLFTPDFRAGLTAVIEDNRLSHLTPDGKLASGEIRGAQGGRNHGVGLSMRYDTLDDAYSPRQGQVVNFSYLRISPLLASTFDFATMDLNAKTFHALAPKDVVGAQLYAGHGAGQMPFYNLYQLGGKNLLRGYYYGRYRDRNMLVAQTEWRHRLTGPWGSAVFAGVGGVAPEKDAFNATEVKPAGGFGVRYQLVERTKINIRLDFGFGRGERNPSVYFYILEAF